ncbi:hypothetical protein JW859_01030 [bacterium]|nr:hypothetical protein [bacterium]
MQRTRFAPVIIVLLIVAIAAGSAVPITAIARQSSAVPHNEGAAITISWDAGTEILSWRYYSQGDYNQDGFVTVNDLTPLGQRFGAVGPFDENSAAACVDGNSDGMITVNDITYIGVNFDNAITGYNVYRSTSLDDYPTDPTEPNGETAELVANVPFSAAEHPPAERAVFSYALADPQADFYYWVRPTDGVADGTPSNYLTFYDTGNWRIEIVDDTADCGRYASLELDDDGRPHISYFDWDNQDLKYAVRDHGSWNVATIASAASTGWFTSLALDQSNTPYISYYNDSANQLEVTYWTGTTWAVDVVDTDSGINTSTSLVIDAAGYPRLAYFDSIAYQLKYAVKGMSGWTIETVDQTGYQDCWHASLALDSLQTPHISYFNNGRVGYATFDGSEWQTRSMGGFESGKFNSIAIGPDDNPRISYHNFFAWDLRYLAYDGAEWHNYILDNISGGEVLGGVGLYSSLVFDANGHPHIAHCRWITSPQELRHTYYNGEEWVTEVVDDNGEVGTFCTLDVDAGGKPHFAYYDETLGALKYATPK